MVAFGIELNRLPSGEDEFGRCGAIVDRPSEIGKGPPQVVESRPLGTLWPKQSRKCTSPVRTIGFHREVRQQRSYFI